MKTFNDFKLKTNESARQTFIFDAINEHRGSVAYQTAADAEAYDRKQNPTIMKYQKLLYTLSGQAVPDKYTANHKVASGFFNRFVTQECQYLLGNGLTLEEAENKERLGSDFDMQLQRLGRAALVGGCGFGFWNYDHLEVFKLTEFVPLYDEENGALMAGVRYWQVAPDKPLRATLFEVDGYTDYLKQSNGHVEIIHEKRPYIELIKTSGIDGTIIYDGENYPTFPVMPLWGNEYKQSELIGIREQIDAYDLIKSGFANDLDDASLIYWTLENAGGMDDIDLAKFIERMKTVKAAVVDGDAGAKAEAHTLDVPYAGRTAYLERLENDLYNDFQALNVIKLTAGAKTATEITAAYEPLNTKTDMFEYQVLDFLDRLFKLVGIEDEPTFKRSRIVNQLEETQMVLMAAQYLDDETILKKLPWLTPDEVDGIMERKIAEEGNRVTELEAELAEMEANAGANEPAAGGTPPEVINE